MGLNLNIRRIIFSTLQKHDGQNTITCISDSDIKQIAGRAGRLEKEGGYVLAKTPKAVNKLSEVLGGINLQYEKQDKHSNLSLKVEDEVQNAEDLAPPEIIVQVKPPGNIDLDVPSFTDNQKNIKKAILMPSYQHIEEFSNNVKVLAGKELRYSEILRKLDSIAKVGGMYTLQNYDLVCAVGLSKGSWQTFCKTRSSHYTSAITSVSLQCLSRSVLWTHTLRNLRAGTRSTPTLWTSSSSGSRNTASLEK